MLFDVQLIEKTQVKFLLTTLYVLLKIQCLSKVSCVL